MFREVFVSDDGILSQAFAAFGWITLAPVPFVANLEETFLDAGAHRPILAEALGRKRKYVRKTRKEIKYNRIY